MNRKDLKFFQQRESVRFELQQIDWCLTKFDNNSADIDEFADYDIAVLPYFTGGKLIITKTRSAKPSYLSYLDYLGEFYGHDARI